MSGMGAKSGQHRAVLSIIVVALGCSPACQSFDDLFEGQTVPSATDIPGFGVQLILNNQSGLPVTIDAVFQSAGRDVRRTTRVLSASGIESAEAVGWTRADSVTVTAWVIDDALLTSSTRGRTGDILLQREFVRDVDFREGDTLPVVILAAEKPPASPLPDCNQNDVADVFDIAWGTSQDCNGNGLPDECDLASGISRDDDADGMPDACQSGACCFGDGACVDMLLTDCRATGGEPLGAGTACEEGACQPLAITGACCFDDGSCGKLNADECASQGGAFQGEGSDCQTAVCEPPIEACCSSEHSCADVPAEECLATGGQPQGPGTSCDSVECSGVAPPLEACCFSDGSCSDLDPPECLASGGEPRGAGSNCSTTTCEPG